MKYKNKTIQLKSFLEQQKKNAEQLQSMTAANQEAQREVSKLRNTFARHDMGSLALNKPGLNRKASKQRNKKS